MKTSSLSALIPVLASPLALQAAPQAAKPDIILFIVDDMGWQDTSLPFGPDTTAYNRMFHTPNMERLARQSTVFTQAYATPISSPSRCSLFTGANAARHKVTNWTLERGKSTDLQRPGITLPDWNVNGICPADSVPLSYHAKALPEILKESGYHTIHCGKAHLGAKDTPGADPLNWGFDVNIAGHAGGGLATYLSEYNYGHTPEGKPYSLLSVPGLEEYWQSGTFVTEALTLEALKALDDAKNQGKPYFLNMSHYAVHIPIDRDERFYSKYIQTGLTPKEAAYASLVEGMDKSLGDILDWVEKNDRKRNTVIIFISDNGGLATQPQWRDGLPFTQNSPLRSGKGSLLEGGIRIPMMVSIPGCHDEVEKRTDTPVIIEDLFPTILEIAGAGIPGNLPQTLDGQSIIPAIYGEIQTGDRTFIWNFPNIWGNEGPGINLNCAIRKGPWKLIYDYPSGRKELYHIPSDISELNEVSFENHYVTRSLSEELGKLLRQRGAQRPCSSDGMPFPWPDEI